MHYKPAILALEDGSLFEGIAIGAEGQATGEVVFNTAMSGYQEILTDPSYAQQIITFTYPSYREYRHHPEDDESDKVWASGMVIRDLPMLASNFRNEQSWVISESSAMLSPSAILIPAAYSHPAGIMGPQWLHYAGAAGCD